MELHGEVRTTEEEWSEGGRARAVGDRASMREERGVTGEEVFRHG